MGGWKKPAVLNHSQRKRSKECQKRREEKLLLMYCSIALTLTPPTEHGISIQRPTTCLWQSSSYPQAWQMAGRPGTDRFRHRTYHARITFQSSQASSTILANGTFAAQAVGKESRSICEILEHVYYF